MHTISAKNTKLIHNTEPQTAGCNGNHPRSEDQYTAQPASHSLRHLCTAQGFLGQASQAASQAEKTEIRLSIKKDVEDPFTKPFPRKQKKKKQKNDLLSVTISYTLARNYVISGLNK